MGTEDGIDPTPEQVRAELDRRLRGQPGFVGTGLRPSDGTPTVIIYTGPGWKEPRDVKTRFPGVRVETSAIGEVRPQ